MSGEIITEVVLKVSGAGKNSSINTMSECFMF